MSPAGSQAHKYYPLPKAGDFVWCRFPEGISLIAPGPKERPALVLRAFTDDAGNAAVTVAYCTSKKVAEHEIRATEILLHEDETIDFHRTGLRTTTKVDLGHVVDLPYSSEFFVPPVNPRFGKIPKMGAIHPAYSERIKAAYKCGLGL